VAPSLACAVQAYCLTDQYISLGRVRSAHALRAYWVSDGHGEGCTRLEEHLPSKLGSRLRLRGNWHDGEVCASREAAVSLGNILKWLLIAFVIWWIVQEPVNAAHLVHNIGNLLTSAASGLSHFVASI
jgi:hypothetical protein